MNRPPAEKLKRLRAFAWLLDSSIRLPGGFRIGLDPLLGLIPGLGDALGALLGLYIIYEARRLGASRTLILKMIANMLIDAVIGAVPILGDIFDAAFKANLRNVALLEQMAEKDNVTAEAQRTLSGSESE
jgi:hypothetical protein